MKATFIAVLVLLSAVTSSAATGFRCDGQGIRIQFYRHGDFSPAALIVSSRGIGTIATLKDEEIVEGKTSRTQNFQGQTKSWLTGDPLDVEFFVVDEAREDGKYAGSHFGQLIVTDEGGTYKINMACSPYPEEV